MKNNYFRYYKPNAVIIFIMIIGSILSMIMSFLIKLINYNLHMDYFQYPSTIALIGMIVFGIDRWGFKITPFNKLFDIPYIHGRYEGEISYKHPISHEQESKSCIIEIFQTGSKLKVNSYFKKPNNQEQTTSESLIESIIKNEDDSFSLVYTYQNDGLNGKFPPHSGTNILKVIINEDGKFLKGNYYTNRDPQTKGYVDVKFISKTLKYDF